jgi:hypothetical protein
VVERKSIAGPDVNPAVSDEALDTAHARLYVLCHECRDPVAVISTPQGGLLEVNGSFRRLFRIPEPLPVSRTIERLGAARALGHGRRGPMASMRPVSGGEFT